MRDAGQSLRDQRKWLPDSFCRRLHRVLEHQQLRYSRPGHGNKTCDRCDRQRFGFRSVDRQRVRYVRDGLHRRERPGAGRRSATTSSARILWCRSLLCPRSTLARRFPSSSRPATLRRRNSFQGNNVGLSTVVFDNTRNWLIGGNTDAESNVMMGVRCGFSHPRIVEHGAARQLQPAQLSAPLLTRRQFRTAGRWLPGGAQCHPQFVLAGSRHGRRTSLQPDRRQWQLRPGLPGS